MSFLFNYIETSQLEYGSEYALLVTFLFIVLAGILSVKIKLKFIFLINIASALLSMFLGGMFITSPNESWFNPFGMNFAIALMGSMILTGTLIVRTIYKQYISNSTNSK